MMESEYICDYCSRSFTRKYNLLTHIENCHLNESCYCVICEQRFGSPAGLQLHLSRGHNRYSQALPECDICGRIFTRKQNITSHMMTVHLQVLTPIQCNLCSKLFTTERNMKRHKRQIHNPIEFLTCDECHKSFNRKRSLMLHIQTVHSKNSIENTFKKVECSMKSDLTCSFCSKMYTSNYILKRHIRTVHIDNLKYFTCKYCSKSIIGKNNFQKHITLYHRKRNNTAYQYLKDLTKLNLICDTCDMNCEDENSLRQHIKKDHGFQDFYKYCKKALLVKTIEKYYDRKQIYNCEFCSYIFGTTCDLKYHMNSNHNINYFYSTCKICYRKFFSKETIRMHKKFCLPPVNVKSCSNCDKLFTNSSSLEFHIKKFHPNVQINGSKTSSIKEYDFINKLDESSLKCHTKNDSMDKIIHSEDKNWKNANDTISSSGLDLNLNKGYTESFSEVSHKCIECSTNFKEKRSLRRHVRTKHSNSTNYPECHICKLRFESTNSCSRHLKTVHNIIITPSIPLQTVSKDNFFKCDLCNDVFIENVLYEDHKKTHMTTNQVPRCIICVKHFSSRKTLKRHIKKFHSDFQTDELADFGTLKQEFNVTCEECIKNFTDKYYFDVYQKWKHDPKLIIFKCETCKCSYNCLEYAIQRYKQNFDITKSKLYLSELCTTEMSDAESQISQVDPISSTVDIKSEPESVKTEPNSGDDSDYENVKMGFDSTFKCNLKSKHLSLSEI